MKKSNLIMLALGLIATLTITSCEVQQNRYTRRPEYRRYHDRDRYDNHHGDRRDDHYDRRY
jgi:hypothetical protein